MQFKLSTLFFITLAGAAIALFVASQTNRGMIDIDTTGRLQAEQPQLMFGKRIEKTFKAPIIRIIDADTVELLLEDKTTPNCRLESIDAPETGSKNISGQPFGDKATEALKRLTNGKQIVIHQTGIDGFKRPLVFIEADGINVNAELIRQGYAWAYTEYNDDAELARLELEAKQANRGLWADPEPMAPWAWRKQQREKRKSE